MRVLQTWKGSLGSGRCQPLSSVPSSRTLFLL
jgi:hypothetical protein